MQKIHKWFYATSILIFSLFIVSCGVTYQESFFTKLSSVDFEISRAHYEQANKQLKNLEKKSVQAEQHLSIAKRYVQMRYFTEARRFLTKSVKKFPNDMRITSVYAWVLLKCDDIDKAYEAAKILENTDYSGIYAEACLKKFALNLSKNPDDSENQGQQKPIEQIKKEYIKSDLQSAYLTAYKVSNQIKFLQNAAIFECCNGDMKKAFSFHPIRLPNDESAEFWMLVSYDSQNYMQAIEDAKVIGTRNAKLKSKAYVLSADAYLRMREIKLAQQMWDAAFTYDEKSEPSVLVNYALSYINEGETEKALKYVKNSVNLFPDYFPGLSLYCKFAINDSVSQSESSLARALRQMGLRSLEMIRLDAREKIQISDAVHRMQESYDRTKNPAIQVELLKLKWANEKNLSKMEMVSDIWGLLEAFYSNEEKGDKRVLDFAIEIFMQQDEFVSASMLLEKRLNDEFGDSDCMAHLDNLSYQECRLFAAIKHHEGLDESAQKLLAKCLDGYELVNDDVYVNLGSYCEAEGNTKQAVDYYSTVISKTLNVITKADLYYRLAMIKWNENNLKEARSYLDYCLRLHPTHSNASRMQKILAKQI